MKRIQVGMAALLLALASFSSLAKGESSAVFVNQPQENGVFKGVLYKVWQRLRSYSPKRDEKGSSKVIATTGARASETTASLLQPLWKDELGEEARFVGQQRLLQQAEQQIEKGELAAAKRSLQQFQKSYPQGELLPNARFTLGMLYSIQGEESKGRQELRDFIASNPKHPLVSDARQLIAELK